MHPLLAVLLLVTVAGCAGTVKPASQPQTGAPPSPSAEGGKATDAQRRRPTGARVAFTFGERGDRIGQFRAPEAIAVDRPGNIFVAERLNNRIQKFDHTGHYLLQFGSLGKGDSQFDYPMALEARRGLYLYVLDANNERLMKFDLNGTPSGTVLNLAADKVRSQVGIVRPRGFAVDATGNIYVSDRERDRVLVFNTFLEYRYQMGSTGHGQGNLSDPRGIVTLDNGDVLVADSGNSRIVRFSSLGSYQDVIFLPSSAVPAAPRGLAQDAAGLIYVADPAANRVIALDARGGELFTIGAGSGDDALDSPSDVALDGEGRLYVADTGHDRVVVYDLQYR
jgi:DNA-binding beta-propeller fold protein YncE